jgi:YD repeat-containing protein
LAQASTTYTYDAQGQILIVVTPAQKVTYAYDAAGNRTVMVATAPAGLAAAGLAPASNATAVTSASTRAFVAPPRPPAPVFSNRAPPPPPISPLTGQPLPSAALSSSR